MLTSRTSEIADIVSRFSPAQACRQLVALAEQRGTDDNLSVQVVQINEVEKVALYRGVAMYQEAADPTTKYELRPGQILATVFRSLRPSAGRDGDAYSRRWTF